MITWKPLIDSKFVFLCGKLSHCNTIEEQEFLCYDYYRDYYQTYNVTITLAPTLSCNLNCVYCYNKKEIRNTYNNNSDKTVNDEIWHKKIIGFIGHYIDRISPDSVNIVWYGGEPLLKFELFDSLSLNLVDLWNKKYKIKIDIITNGTLLDSRRINKLSHLPIGTIQITIDGNKFFHNKMRPYKNGKGSYRIIFANIVELLNELDAKISIRVNIGQDNLNFDSIRELAKKVKILREKFGSKRIVLEIPTLITSSKFYNNTLTPQNYGSNYIPKLYKIYKEENIDIGDSLLFIKPMCTLRSKNDIVIGPYGKIYKCWEHIGEAGYSVGDVEKGINSTLLKKWNEIAMLTESSKCTNCPFFDSCLGGCPLFKINKTQPLCPFQKYSMDFYLKELSGNIHG